MYEAAYKMLGGDGNKMVSLDSTIIEIRNDITIQNFGQAVTIFNTLTGMGFATENKLLIALDH